MNHWIQDAVHRYHGLLSSAKAFVDGPLYGLVRVSRRRADDMPQSWYDVLHVQCGQDKACHALVLPYVQAQRLRDVLARDFGCKEAMRLCHVATAVAGTDSQGHTLRTFAPVLGTMVVPQCSAGGIRLSGVKEVYDDLMHMVVQAEFDGIVFGPDSSAESSNAVPQTWTSWWKHGEASP